MQKPFDSWWEKPAQNYAKENRIIETCCREQRLTFKTTAKLKSNIDSALSWNFPGTPKLAFETIDSSERKLCEFNAMSTSRRKKLSVRTKGIRYAHQECEYVLPFPETFPFGIRRKPEALRVSVTFGSHLSVLKMVATHRSIPRTFSFYKVVKCDFLPSKQQNYLPDTTELSTSTKRLRVKKASKIPVIFIFYDVRPRNHSLDRIADFNKSNNDKIRALWKININKKSFTSCSFLQNPKVIVRQTRSMQNLRHY